MRARALALIVCLLASVRMPAIASEVYCDVEFARPEGIVLHLDASIPDGPGPFPAAVVVHGGAWVRGDRRLDVAPLLPALSDGGIAWFTIDYRLTANPLRFGLAVNDVQSAVRFVREHAGEYHVDPDRIALIGESAGGHLAAMAALDEDISVKTVVALYAPTDLVKLAKSSDLIPDSLRQQLRGTPLEGLIMAQMEQLSPIKRVHPGMPPFLLIHGTADEVVPIEQSRAMCKRIETVGGDCELFSVPGAGHGLRRWESSSSMAAPYKREMIRWLREKLAINPLQVL